MEKHYRENLVRPKNKKTDSDDSEGDSCDSGDDSDIQNSVNHSPRSKDNKSNTNRKAGVSKSKKRPTARNKVDRNRKDNYNSRSDDDSDDENFDKEDWNAGYEDTGSDFEFSLMVCLHLLYWFVSGDFLLGTSANIRTGFPYRS